MIKKRLVGLLSHAKKYIVYQVIWQWLSLLCQILLIYSGTTLLTEALSGNVTPRMAAMYGILTVLAIALRVFCERGASKASCRASVDVKRILRDKIYDKLLRLGVSYRERVSTSEVVQLSGEGVDQLETYFGKYLPQLFYSLLAPVTLFAVLAFVNLPASLVLLICVPLIPASIVAVQKIAGRLLAKYWGIYTDLGDSFLENIQGLTTLKIYQADERKAAEMDEESQRFRRITMKVLTMQLNSTTVMDIVAYGGAAVGMIVALQQFAAGHVGLQGTLMIVLLAAEFFLPLRLLGSFFHIAMNGMAASDKIFALLDLPEPERGTEVIPVPGEQTEETVPVAGRSVSVRNLHFSYEMEREILKGVSLEIPAGSFVSLVGVSGCGKSTAAGLLTGRNRGYTGSIRIGGKELSAVSEESLLTTVTLVAHNSYLFKGTVEENLRMGNPDLREERMVEILRKVNLWDFLKGQEGLQTRLLEKGSNLSGGQCQRLCIARALLRDTPVYIFDEATSNIDMESEELIMEVIRELSGKKTVILISHRLANVVGSDRIYLLQKGIVAEEGTHRELMDKGGAYAKLYSYQTELEQYAHGEPYGKEEPE
ncbi:MAG TPA: ABC transporter ATP-binding protein/permease [Candidatus Scatomonas pullistercoris]|uniref:ABC transporter ATP-binding protein/permease n=1 Tax=Candidatus Scatomonas pullistercoris TaxID=2840920 RepID=A0A9D1P4G3_9FIRM|nr:ABC transporter ATP-binding protein/permease [Candidatus Scatomonas pullistercoris]